MLFPALRRANPDLGGRWTDSSPTIARSPICSTASRNLLEHLDFEETSVIPALREMPSLG
ncbi:hypothetical protein [Micromonospora sp. NPDC005367]|uniref:hypothetical protein n=1 Tax=Micromonospora sp. NPDC005367 TaxID=3155590 RepID=UPI0033B325E4